MNDEIYPWQNKYFVFRHNLPVQENEAVSLLCNDDSSCTTSSKTS